MLDGKSMTYLGRKVKRSNPKVSDYMLVPAGERLESAMDIAKFYDFSEAGEYAVTINLPEIDGVAMLNQETSVTIDCVIGTSVPVSFAADNRGTNEPITPSLNKSHASSFPGTARLPSPRSEPAWVSIQSCVDGKLRKPKCDATCRLSVAN